MSKAKMLVVVVMLILLLLAACAPKAAPTPTPTPAPVPRPVPAPVAPAPAAPAKAAWEQEWEKTVEAAKKEGELVLVTSAGVEARRELTVGFSKAFGIKVEAIGARAPEAIAKTLAERRAGLCLSDSNIYGSSSIVNDLKPAGATDPLEPLLILPDLTNPEVIKKVWYGGKLPWVDRDHHMLMGLLYFDAPIAINTDLVKKGEITSYQDLLNPKWKDKMVFNDPTISGFSGANFMPMIVLGGTAGGVSWLREVAKNEPIVIRDQRLMLDWLAHGKVAIVIAPKPDTTLEFIRAGAPIATVVPKEGTVLSGSSSVIIAMNKRPHPNATKLFINWYMSKDGQTAFSRGYGGQSGREDVPTDFLSPGQLRQPGMTYYFKDEEDKLRRADEVYKIAKEIIGPLIK